MDEKVRAITLRTVEYKDSDKIITLFTLERGKITVSARGVRKANAKLKSFAEPFCFADLVLKERAGRFTAAEADVVDSFYPLRTDVYKFYAGTVALEFTSAFMQEGEVDAEYFVSLADFLNKCAYSTINAEDLLINFLLGSLKKTGYGVELSRCGRCGNKISDRVFLSAEGVCVCEDCVKSGDREFSFDTYAYLGKRSLSPEGGHSDLSAKNSLRFISHYLGALTGTDLRTLSQLIEL